MKKSSNNSPIDSSDKQLSVSSNSVLLDNSAISDFHVRRARKHLYLSREYDTLGDQIEYHFPDREVSFYSLQEKDKKPNIKSIGGDSKSSSLKESSNNDTKKMFNVTMIISSRYANYYKRNYEFKEAYDDGSYCVVQGKVYPSELESNDFYGHTGVVHELYPKITKLEASKIEKELKDKKDYISEKIANDIKQLSAQIEQKKKVLNLYKK